MEINNEDENSKASFNAVDDDKTGVEKLQPDPVSVDEQTISIDDYIKASVTAGDRVRKLLYILSFASAIAFMAYWNSKSDGWINNRFENIQEAEERYLDLKEDSTKALKYLHDIKSKRDFVNIKSFLDDRHINSASKIRDYEKIFQDLKESTFQVKVPILGINFDINDLSIFAGLTFLFILFLLFSSIGREGENLDITFQFAEENKKLNKIYTYLAMGQVLSYPPKPNSNVLNETSGYKKIIFFLKKNVAKGLYIIPVLVESVIIWHDYRSKYLGTSLNLNLTYDEFHLSLLILFVLLFLSILCIHRTAKIDKVWNKYFQSTFLKKDKI